MKLSWIVISLVLFGLAEGGGSDKKLILIFVDGLRWDLVNGENLPGFKKLFESGTRAEHLKPVFPSLCYPNFYTMMTGLYPESHGLIGNNIYDPVAGDFFRSRGDPERQAGDHYWEGGEPIWITARKQKKESYLYHLAGCDREINGQRPEFCMKVRNDVDLMSLSNSLADGLKNIREGKADFVGVYYGELDTVGHQHGPNSYVMRQKIRDLDEVILSLLHDLWEQGLNKFTNVVLISDHGMTDASIDQTIDLRRLIGKNDVDHVLEAGAYVSVWPKTDRIEKVYSQLKLHPNLHVYTKEEIPDSWHYKGSHRVAPITAVADLGWFIVTHDYGYLGFGPRKTPARGMHGYHTHHPDMWGVLAAVGPDIHVNRTVGPMELVDVYQALSHLLDLKPAPHNGTWDNVAPLFRLRQENAPNPEKLLTSSYDVKLNQSPRLSCPPLITVILLVISLFKMI